MSDDNEQLRAELARVTAERDEVRAELMRQIAERDEVRARARELRREVEALKAERDRTRADGRAAGLQEAQEACRWVVGRMLDLAMEGGGTVRCAEAFGDGDGYDADEEQCEFIAAGASLCGEAIEALITKGGGA